MSRVNVGRAAVVVAVGAASVVAVAGGLGYSGRYVEYSSREDVDRAAYIGENGKLLARVPPFPGTTRVDVRHEATRYYQDMCFLVCDTFIDGYITHVTFRSPASTTAAEITRFFERRLPPLGWRHAHWQNLPAGWPRPITGKPDVTNVGFNAGDARMSIDLIPFIQGDKIVRGGQFIVHVNHGGYRAR